jgi:methyl-accepting chemotaxis protein
MTDTVSGARSGSSFTLGRKLGIGFAGLTMLTVALGGLAINRMSAMNAATIVVRDNYLVSTLATAKLLVAIENVRLAESRYAMSTSNETVERAMGMKTLEAAVAEANAARQAYDADIDPGKEREGYTTTFDRVWPVFEADVRQTVKLTDDHQLVEATTQFRGKSEADYHALMNFMRWDLNYNQVQGFAAGAVSQNVYVSTWWVVFGALLAAVCLSMITALALIRHISRPISEMTAAMRRLAAKDLSVVVPSVGRGDEIGAMAGAVQVFKESMVEAERLGVEQAEQQAVRQKRSQAIETLVTDFERQIGNTVSVLASASTEMEATASSMTGSAEQTDRQAIEVARAAQDSSAAVQTVAAASEQLASSITEINRQVASSASMTGKAVGSVRRTDDTVRALAESAVRIGDVVALITSIASQTNLLALNATIEAARAGDAGKGFAVVASEVKSLAQQTARATDEIATQIAQVQQASNGAVEAIREIGGLIEEVGAITTSIAAAVEQQGAATAEIARNVQQTAASTQTVTVNIAGVSRAANDTGAAASQVLGAAGDLSRQAERLSTEVDSFIAKVRVA